MAALGLKSAVTALEFLGPLSTHCRRLPAGMLFFANRAGTNLDQRGVTFANQWLSKYLVCFAPEDDPGANEAVGYLVNAASKEGISRTELEQVGDLNAFIINAWSHTARNRAGS